MSELLISDLGARAMVALELKELPYDDTYGDAIAQFVKVIRSTLFEYAKVINLPTASPAAHLLAMDTNLLGGMSEITGKLGIAVPVMGQVIVVYRPELVSELHDEAAVLVDQMERIGKDEITDVEIIRTTRAQLSLFCKGARTAEREAWERRRHHIPAV